MKRISKLCYLILAASSLLFFQCTSEYTAIPGADGKDGVDGLDGLDGQDTSAAACISCHSNSHRDPIHADFEVSDHFNQSTIPWAGNVTLAQYTNRGDDGQDCAKCHSNEGYIDYITTGAIAPTNYPNPTAVNCTTCHSNHSTFDFENDGADYALRTIEPVELAVGGTIDYQGTSNSCVECHQPRRTGPTDDGSGMFTITPHYGPHYGAQSTMLEGTLGALIPGSEGYPGVGTSTHRTGASCVSCHMGEPNEDDGSHTFKPTLNSCITCHTSATDFNVNGVQTEVENLMHELELLLVAEGILAPNGFGGVDLVTGDHSVLVSNAYWNWEYVHQDHSNGIHNPAYTLALLKNSIEALQD